MSRVIEFVNGDIEIIQGEDGVYDGATIFDAGLVLIHYLQKCVKEGTLDFNGKSVIDLGSGTGIVGIAAGKLGGLVTLTDLEDGMSLIDKNVEMNFNSSKNTCKTAVLQW